MKTKNVKSIKAGKLVVAKHLGLTEKQTELYLKHGTPAEFSSAVYEAVPAFLSMDEAKAAVEKYQREWGNSPPLSR